MLAYRALRVLVVLQDLLVLDHLGPQAHQDQVDPQEQVAQAHQGLLALRVQQVQEVRVRQALQVLVGRRVLREPMPQAPVGRLARQVQLE